MRQRTGIVRLAKEDTQSTKRDISNLESATKKKKQGILTRWLVRYKCPPLLPTKKGSLELTGFKDNAVRLGDLYMRYSLGRWMNPPESESMTQLSSQQSDPITGGFTYLRDILAHVFDPS